MTLCANRKALAQNSLFKSVCLELDGKIMSAHYIHGIESTFVMMEKFDLPDESPIHQSGSDIV